jgi:hypothetical protein
VMPIADYRQVTGSEAVTAGPTARDDEPATADSLGAGRHPHDGFIESQDLSLMGHPTGD